MLECRRAGLLYGDVDPVDPVVPEPKATEVLWGFFKSHPRR
jgi:hypothetical protein